jgi:hypothetical protein
MSSRPLPGASYHTLETILHSFANVDLEAVGSLETLESPSEKKSPPSDESTPLLESRARIRHAWPMLLSLLVFFCLAFTASAFLGYSAGRWLMPDVPDRHVSIADHLSSAFQAQSHRTLVNEYYNGVLAMMNQKLNCLRDDECQGLKVRDFLLRAFPLLDPSLNRTDVAESAVVLHWQGTDSSLKPVLITNSDAVLDVNAPQKHAQHLSCGNDNVDHQVEIADVQSGVGMMIALDALLRSGHRPSRSLIFSLVLGEASDAPEVSEYLRAAYGELGLGMEFEPPAPICEGLKASRLFRKFIGETPGATVTLHPTSSVSRHAQAKPFDADEPRLFRYIFSSTINQASLTRLRVKATRVWTRLILGADGF